MNQENKITELEARIDKLEHAILVMVSWSHGQADYIRDILTPEKMPELNLADVQGLLNRLTRGSK